MTFFNQDAEFKDSNEALETVSNIPLVALQKATFAQAFVIRTLVI